MSTGSRPAPRSARVGEGAHRPVPTRLGFAVGASMVLGLLAGLLVSLFLGVTAEPAIEEAIAIEEATAIEEGADGRPASEIVSRSLQRGPGRYAAYAVGGSSFGLLFGLVVTALRRWYPGAFGRAVVTAGVLAGAITVSPWLKYPPNPPAVGDPATLAQRQQWYLALVVATALLLLAAAGLAARLRRAGWPPHRRVAVVALAVVVPLLALFGLLPPAPDPVEVPATLVWRFRVASLGGNLLLWGILAVGFGWLAAEREAAAADVAAPRR